MRGPARRLAACLWLLAGTATAQLLPNSSGWHTWRVAALDGSNHGCCYSWQFGKGARGGACRLSGNGLEAAKLGHSVGMQPGQHSKHVRIFARLDQGRIIDAQAVSDRCPVDADVELDDLGTIDAQVSLSWLQRAWREQDGDEDLLQVIAQHAGGDEALIDLVEDPDLDQARRKGALFWLAESATDRAVAWFDNLLTN
mgnify:CR=1 FL=1